MYFVIISQCSGGLK